MRRASIVMPVRNGALTLPDSIGCLLGQSLQDFELLCVDDGSTDGSAEVISGFASDDTRVRLLRQPPSDAGTARNRGLAAARGEFITFLDCDDVFDPALLEVTSEALRQTGADVCSFGFDTFAGSPPESSSAETTPTPAARLVEPSADPDHALQLSTTSVWLKTFRRSFLVANRIRFQAIQRTNDLVFSSLAMACAGSVVLLPRKLVHYRVSRPDSLQANPGITPLDPLNALLELRRELDRRTLLDRYRRSFHNQCVDILWYNLQRIPHGEARSELQRAVRAQAGELGLPGHGPSYYFNTDRWDFLAGLLADPATS